MRAYAGIGCHYMAQWMDRSTLGFTQMGGEGANWMGEALFSTRNHVFQNIGDGTYNHSGSLAIRAAVAAGINVTYKILFNDAVAMTGGQANDGKLTVPLIAKQMVGEAAARVVVVTDEPEKYSKNEDWPRGVSIHHRDELMAVQTELAAIPGVTVLIYDQTCAAEKRRRRKRGLYPDPDKRVIINELVCEGCGDCGVQSNCVSIQPLETEFGRKRKIDQSSCNKDYSCLKGFCPSLVTVHGGKPKRRAAAIEGLTLPDLPQPHAAGAGRALRHHRHRHRRHGRRHHRRHSGHGGASGRHGRRCHRHVRPGAKGRAGAQPYPHRGTAGRHPCHPRAGRRRRSRARRRYGGGGQQERAGGGERGPHAHGGESCGIPAGRIHPQCRLHAARKRIERAITEAAGRERSHFVDATRIASGLLGNSIGANIFLLGYAYQLGTLPLSAAAIEQAIALNGEAVAMNHAAFRWGRAGRCRSRQDRGLLRPLTEESADDRRLSQSFDEMVAAAGSFPHRLSGRRLCRALPRPWSSVPRPRKPRRRRASAALPKRWRAICSS